MVNERVGAGNWDSGAELGDTWATRNSFSYGRGGERGTARPEVRRGAAACAADASSAAASPRS
jgi:cobalamin biosynthesis Mg chelatase CobN